MKVSYGLRNRTEQIHKASSIANPSRRWKKILHAIEQSCRLPVIISEGVHKVHVTMVRLRLLRYSIQGEEVIGHKREVFYEPTPD